MRMEIVSTSIMSFIYLEDIVYEIDWRFGTSCMVYLDDNNICIESRSF